MAALTTGPKSTDALVDALYQGLAERLRTMAAHSVNAHLHKLQDDRRVVRRRDAWAIPIPRRARAE
jgi:hypothetical protein